MGGCKLVKPIGSKGWPTSELEVLTTHQACFMTEKMWTYKKIITRQSLINMNLYYLINITKFLINYIFK